MSEKTTIQIDKEVKTTLSSMGKKDQSYNDIVIALIEKTKYINTVSGTEEFRTANVGIAGKAFISKKLVGHVIEWRVKQ